MDLAITGLAALVGASIFHRLDVPSGALLGAMVFVGAANVLAESDIPPLPDNARFFAYASLGWLVGQGVTRETLRLLLSSAIPVILTVAVLVAVGIGAGWLLGLMSPVDPASAMLATSPGALSQMSAIAVSVGADPALVVSVHTLRVVVLIAVSPLIARLAEASAN